MRVLMLKFSGAALFCVFLLFVSACGNKMPDESKQIAKAQKVYDKKGLDGFYEYVKNGGMYFAVKDSSQNGATPLLISIKNGEIEKARLFLQKGALPNEKDFHEQDILDYAFLYYDTLKDVWGADCLYYYDIARSYSEMLEFVVSNIPVSYWHSCDFNGKCPLVKIVEQCQNFDITKRCIDLVKDINQVDCEGKSFLMYAAQCNVDVRVLKYLLDKGAEIDLKNGNEWTALMYAARYNPNPSVMEDLILRGASMKENSVGLTITMLASCNSNPGVLMTLLKYKNEINSSTKQGKTALMYACENNQNYSLIKILIDNGANIEASDFEGKTAREYLSEDSVLSTSDIAMIWNSSKHSDEIITDDKNLDSADINVEQNNIAGE